MNIMQAMVGDWHKRFGVLVGDTPAICRPTLRAALIEEESRETCDAIRRGDLAEAIDGMCDVLYVIFGTAIEFGIDLAPFFEEVHNTNMLKVGGATREDGKILKPEGWQPPRIAEMLRGMEVFACKGCGAPKQLRLLSSDGYCMSCKPHNLGCTEYPFIDGLETSCHSLECWCRTMPIERRAIANP